MNGYIKKRYLLIFFASLIINSVSITSIFAQQTQPNIVFVFLDDASQGEIGNEAISSYFPAMSEHLLESGAYFENFHIVAPICGPSRAALFRGQYAHNTGVLHNQLGWEIFYNSGYTDDEMGMWMQEAGYHTALVGKYCHEEFPVASHDLAFVPPGWNDFRASLGGKYREFEGLENGTRITHNAAVENHRTDVEADNAVSIIEEHDFSEPLFLYVAPYAPHVASASSYPIYADRHATDFSNAQLERIPSLDEADVSDKANQIVALPALGTQGVEAQDALFRDRLRSIKSVDEMLDRIVAELERRGVIDSTYIFLTSDNGYLQGHHRLFAKQWPYDRVTRVPLLVRGPGIAAGTRHTELLGHIDLVPTFLDIAGVDAPHFVDGESFAGLTSNLASLSGSVPDRDFLFISNDTFEEPVSGELDKRYSALRSNDELYIKWHSGEVEYYNLEDDPWQLENREGSLGRKRIELESELVSLGACSGATCRSNGSTDEMYITLEIEQTGTRLVTSGQLVSDRPVAAVELVVRRVEDRAYFDGQKFSPGYKKLDIQVGSNTSWQTQFDILALQGQEYWLSARVRNNAGNTSRLAATQFFAPTFPADNVKPDVRLNSDDTIVSRDYSISGRAQDDVALKNLVIILQSTEDGLYWNGEGYQTAYHAIAIPEVVFASNDIDWSYSFNGLDTGEHVLRGRLTDQAGNVGFDVVRIDIVNDPSDTTPPQHMSLSPISHQLLNPNSIIAGTVRDGENHIEEITVIFRDRRSGLYWNGSEMQSGFFRVPIAIAQPGSVVDWEFRLTEALATSDYFMAIDAWDSLGNHSRNTAIYLFDGGPPSVSLTVDKDVSTSSTFVFAGLIEDQSALESGQLIIRRISDNQYWNGAALQSNWAFTPIDVGTNQEFVEYELATTGIPTGQYRVRVNARDIASNSSFSAITFTVD